LPAEVQRRSRTSWPAARPRSAFKNGTVKGDIVVHNGEPYVIELAARLSGGSSQPARPLRHGVDFIGARSRSRSANPSRRKNSNRNSSCRLQRYAFPSRQRVRQRAEEAHQIAGVTEVRHGEARRCYPACRRISSAAMVLPPVDTRRRAGGGERCAGLSEDKKPQ